MKKISLKIAKQNIPKDTDYCYTFVKGSFNKYGIPAFVKCPYWSKRKSKPYQMNGYCGYLQRGDWNGPGLGLLWDQVKECGINLPTDYDCH